MIKVAYKYFMLSKTIYSIDTKIIDLAIDNIPSDDFRLTINRPTGRFFYDSWELKDEFKNTVWGEIYNSLPLTIGEARIIKLESGKNYISHADIDDRYHLNLTGVNCFLIDLDSGVLHQTIKDGIWYEMNAGVRHSAINFGNRHRFQLVVRKLLLENNLKKSKHVKMHSSIADLDEARYCFDDQISPWLNAANKQGIINNFVYQNNKVSFDIEEDHIDDLKNRSSDYFYINIE
jgi:hypothetical protein